MANIIPAGYRLSVSSWENDGDYGATKVMQGLSKEKVLYLIELCNLLGPNFDFGNMYDPGPAELDDFTEALKGIITKYPEEVEAMRVMMEEFAADGTGIEGDDEYPFIDYAMEDLYELGLAGGEFYTRRFESFTVEFIPQDVLIEDVTDQFR